MSDWCPHCAVIRKKLAAELAEAKRENARLREQIQEMIDANKWEGPL